jgi:hypothetical protein
MSGVEVFFTSTLISTPDDEPQALVRGPAGIRAQPPCDKAAVTKSTVGPAAREEMPSGRKLEAPTGSTRRCRTTFHKYAGNERIGL